ncbi:MAG: hypothetical protein CMN72_14125 [Sphingomonas sp.]|nr:hypothetical protein [Sphingomonas sp.]
MISEDGEGPLAPHGNAADALLYDYFKYLTSLCVLSLGGVLALSEKVPAAGRGKELLIGAVIVIGCSALLSFSGTGELVRERAPDAPRRSLNFYRVTAPFLLCFGVGMFVYLFIRTLFA